MTKKTHKTKVCEACGERALYNYTYDSYLCPKCNEFLEKKCDDPKCFYCPKRPDRPYEVDA